MGNIASGSDACPEFTATTEMTCLIVLALWSVPLNHIPALARTSKYGLQWTISNREKDREQEMLVYDKAMALWIGRSDRTKANHHDNLPMIAIVILAVTVLGRTDVVTANASLVVTASRLIHSVAYLSGVTVVRSAAYFTSIIALLTIVMRAWAMPTATW